jgi:RNA polymerase sigma-70 factor, ECF subfamily
VSKSLHPLSTLSDADLVSRLVADEKVVFNYVVETHYISLSRYALKFVRNEELAEEIVQDVFVSVWLKRHSLAIASSLQAYLHAAVKYQSLNTLRKKFVKPGAHMEIIDDVHPHAGGPDEELHAHELQAIITRGISQLPEKCRIIFDLSRNAGLTYKEIATQLNISQKTVETQMSIALSRLKAHIGTHWDVLIFVSLLFL